MPEEPGFFSYENFPYPLLALGQAIPRGYQYQSQMTPYKRDARGDWGRAVNESIDQFFQMYPQFLQQKRQFALQREQLQRQRADDAYKAKLRPFELKKLQTESDLQDRRVEMLKNYPQMVQSLPLADKDKAYLVGLPPTEGLSLVKSFLQKRLETPELQTLQPGEPGNPYDVPVQIHPHSKKITAPLGTTRRKTLSPVPINDPRLLQYPEAQRASLRVNEYNQIVTDPAYTTQQQKQAFTKERPSASTRFQTALGEGLQVQSLADLAPFAGNTPAAQQNFALTNLSPDNRVYQMAREDRNQRFVKMGPQGFIVSEGHKGDYRRQNKPFTAGEPQGKIIKSGDTINSIVKFYADKGIKVEPTQLIAANKHWFEDENGAPNPLKMKTSEQMNGQEMNIPTGGGKLTENEIAQAHRSHSDSRGQSIDIPGIGTYFPIRKQPSVSETLELNRELNSMIKMQSTVNDYIDLIKNPKARSYAKLGSEARGKIAGLRWRIINNVQVIREFGVLSPSEIDVIAESVPDPNSFFNLITQGMDSDRFVEGVLRALEAEGITKGNEIKAYMQGLNIPHMTFPIHRYVPPEGPPETATEGQVNQFRSKPTLKL